MDFNRGDREQVKEDFEDGAVATCAATAEQRSL